MKTAFYSVKEYEASYLAVYTQKSDDMLINSRLELSTVSQAAGCGIVSVFTGDDVSVPVVDELHRLGVRFITTRATGVDNIDLGRCTELGITVANVPGYSPHAIAEHAAALMLALNRKIILANAQVHAHDFSTGNLIGFDLAGKTAGIIGCGRIGAVMARIMDGFGCKVLVYDPIIDSSLIATLGVRYVSLEQLLHSSDIVSIHTGLHPATRYLINKNSLALMKPGAILINTGRGACVDTSAVLDALDAGVLGSYGADVYEKEMGVFFHDLSGKRNADPLLERLLANPKVLLTPHQAFATKEALSQIAAVTFDHIRAWNKGEWSLHELVRPAVFPGTISESLLSPTHT